MAGIVIIGATSSTGSCLAKILVDRGDRILLVGRSAEPLSSLADSLGQPCQAVELLTSETFDRAVEANLSVLGNIDGMVNCIGSLWLKPLALTSDEDFSAVLATNLQTSFSVVKVGAKYMRERGGSIVLISSVAASYGLRNHEAIAAAKSGVEGLMRSSAASLASAKIRVNCVAPGLTKTKMTKRLWENASAASASAEMHPLGCLGEPEHIASTIAFLLDPANYWITGQVFSVDGGLSRVQPTRKVVAS